MTCTPDVAVNIKEWHSGFATCSGCTLPQQLRAAFDDLSRGHSAQRRHFGEVLPDLDSVCVAMPSVTDRAISLAFCFSKTLIMTETYLTP